MPEQIHKRQKDREIQEITPETRPAVIEKGLEVFEDLPRSIQNDVLRQITKQLEHIGLPGIRIDGKQHVKVDPLKAIEGLQMTEYALSFADRGRMDDSIAKTDEFVDKMTDKLLDLAQKQLDAPGAVDYTPMSREERSQVRTKGGCMRQAARLVELASAMQARRMQIQEIRHRVQELPSNIVKVMEIENAKADHKGPTYGSLIGNAKNVVVAGAQSETQQAVPVPTEEEQVESEAEGLLK